MKHPIYRNQNDRNLIRFIEEKGIDDMERQIRPIFIQNGLTEEHAKSYANRIIMLYWIEQSGCNLIQLKDAEHWNETLSEKTIKQMHVGDIKLPFRALAVDLTNAAWTKYEYVYIASDEAQLIFSFERNDEGGLHHHQIQLPLDDLVEEAVERVLEKSMGIEKQVEKVMGAFASLIGGSYNKFTDMKQAIYKVISIIMFTTMFKKETERVEIHKIANKGSKKRNTPDHTTNIVYLSQPSYSLTGLEYEGSKRSSDKTWIVKGHFRRQPYGKRDNPQYKTIWIDAVWKGKGSKKLNKVYKI